MSRFAGLGTAPVIGIGAAAVAALVAVGVYFGGQDAPPSEPTPSSAAQAPVAPEMRPADAPAPDARDSVPELTEPRAADADDEAVAEAAPDAETPPPPALDTFRLDPDGQMLVAGRALPGGEVAVTVDDTRLGTAEADRAGKFVVFLDLAPSEKARVLGLELRLEDGRVIRAPDEILIAPAPPPAPRPGWMAEADTAIPPAPEAEETATDATEIATPEEATEDAVPGLAQVRPEETGPALEEMPESPTVQAGRTVETRTAETAEMETGEAGETGVAETTGMEAIATGAAEASGPTREETVSAPDVATPERAALDPAPEVASTGPAAPAVPETGTAPPPDSSGGSAAQSLLAEAPAAPTVMVSDAQGVRVLQAPAEPGPEVMSSVALDSISYSAEGRVQLSGRAVAPDARVRIYLDNRAVTTVPVDESGAWRSALPEVDTGIYTLRVDEVGSAGEVTSRIETPFKREDVETLATQGDTPAPPRMSVVTVQPGSTLWAISRETYGEGILYVRVFEANRDRIRDPDLIYPGQVFELPE